MFYLFISWKDKCRPRFIWHVRIILTKLSTPLSHNCGFTSPINFPIQSLHQHKIYTKLLQWPFCTSNAIIFFTDITTKVEMRLVVKDVFFFSKIDIYMLVLQHPLDKCLAFQIVDLIAVTDDALKFSTERSVRLVGHFSYRICYSRVSK